MNTKKCRAGARPCRGGLLAYVAFGPFLGGSFRHPPLSYGYFLEMQVIGTDGVFGTPLYLAASYALRAARSAEAQPARAVGQ